MGSCNSRQIPSHKEESVISDQPNKLTEIKKPHLAPLPASTHIDHPSTPVASPSTTSSTQSPGISMDMEETPSSAGDTTLVVPTDSEAEEEPILIGEGIFQNELDKSHDISGLQLCAICISYKKKTWRPCKRCNSSYCGGCLREFLIRASKDESLMPPRCCGPYNIGLARFFLTKAEFELYRAKYEEWATVNRVYCPVPTCSVLIPPRLFPTKVENLLPKSKKQKGKEGAPSEKQDPLQVEPSYINCPKCTAQICCSCKQLHHPGSPCPETVDGLDPELAKLFRRWGVKRCYKCHTAVRKMIGCNHISCRCGAQWCFGCTRPKDVCDEDPCGDDEENDDDNDDDNDDGEGREREDEGTSVSQPNDDEEEFEDLDEYVQGDFGEEPDGEEHEFSGCTHSWSKNHEEHITGGINNSNGLFDLCERCLCTVVPQETVYPETAALTQFGFIPHPPVTYDLDSQENSGGKRAVQYAPQDEKRLVHCLYCYLTLCFDCFKKEKLNSWLVMKEYV